MSVAPSQILYLEHGSDRLYAEAIQVVENRHLCWARPTLLIQGLPDTNRQEVRQAAIAAAASDPDHSELTLYDLEGGPDLIWPLELFQIAFDLDFFSLLVQLKMNPNEVTLRSSSSQLNAFIRSFWHNHADIFQLSVPHQPAIDALDAR